MTRSPPSSVQDRLSALRELLYAPPSAALWEALVAQLDAWPEGDDLGVGLAYAAEHLDGWPDALRVCPPRWAKALLVGEGVDPGARVAVARELRAIGTTRGGAWALGALSTWAERPELEGLRALALRHVQVGNNGAAMLARAEGLAGLERLELVSAALSRRGAERLASGALGPRLHTLNLSDNPIGAFGVGVVARRPTTLRSLLASATSLTGDGFEGWPTLPALVLLDVATNRLDPGGLCAQLAALDAPAIEHLNLADCALQARDLDALDRGPWPRLTTLRLRFNDLGDRGLSRLLRCRFIGQLTHLDVAASGLTDASIDALCEGPHLGHLTRLVLDQNAFSEAGIARLRAAPHWRPRCVVV